MLPPSPWEGSSRSPGTVQIDDRLGRLDSHLGPITKVTKAFLDLFQLERTVFTGTPPGKPSVSG